MKDKLKCPRITDKIEREAQGLNRALKLASD